MAMRSLQEIFETLLEDEAAYEKRRDESAEELKAVRSSINLFKKQQRDAAEGGDAEAYKTAEANLRFAEKREAVLSDRTVALPYAGSAADDLYQEISRSLDAECVPAFRRLCDAADQIRQAKREIEEMKERACAVCQAVRRCSDHTGSILVAPLMHEFHTIERPMYTLADRAQHYISRYDGALEKPN